MTTWEILHAFLFCEHEQLIREVSRVPLRSYYVKEVPRHPGMIAALLNQSIPYEAMLTLCPGLSVRRCCFKPQSTS